MFKLCWNIPVVLESLLKEPLTFRAFRLWAASSLCPFLSGCVFEHTYISRSRAIFKSAAIVGGWLIFGPSKLLSVVKFKSQFKKKKTTPLEINAGIEGLPHILLTPNFYALPFCSLYNGLVDGTFLLFTTLRLLPRQGSVCSRELACEIVLHLCRGML